MPAAAGTIAGDDSKEEAAVADGMEGVGEREGGCARGTFSAGWVRGKGDERLTCWAHAGWGRSREGMNTGAETGCLLKAGNGVYNGGAREFRAHVRTVME